MDNVTRRTFRGDSRVPLQSQKLGGYWRVPAIGIAAALVAFVLSFAFPTEYPAVSRMLIRTGETSYSTTDSGASLGTGINIGGIDLTKQQTLGTTLSNLVTARESVQEIVDRIGVDRINGGEAPSRGFVSKVISFLKVGVGRTPTAEEAAIEKVQGALEVVVLDDSWVMEITAWDPDPDYAKVLADTAADVSVEQSANRFRDNSERELAYLAQQLDLTRQGVATRAQAVIDFKTANGIISATDASSSPLAQSDSSSLDALNTTLVGLRARQQVLKNRLVNLGSDFNNPDYAATRSSLDQVESEIVVAEAQFNDVASRLGGGSVSAVNEIELQLSQLQDDLELSQNAYRAISDRYTVVAATVDKPRFDASRLGEAAVPSSPGRPLRYLFLLVGLLVGALAGLLLTWFRAIREDREAEEAEAIGPAMAEPVAEWSDSGTQHGTIDVRDPRPPPPVTEPVGASTWVPGAPQYDRAVVDGEALARSLSEWSGGSASDSVP